MRTNQTYCTLTFNIRHDSDDSLWIQVYRGIMQLIRSGHLDHRTPMPSTRALSRSLGVSRTTVVAAYNKLVDDGVLVARSRSAYYVVESGCGVDHMQGPPEHAATELRPAGPGGRSWTDRIRIDVLGQTNICKPDKWFLYDYPFVYGQPDVSLFPLEEWRQCMVDAHSRMYLAEWMFDTIGRDCKLVRSYIRDEILPRRGVYVRDEDIVVTLGAQQALYLLGHLLVRPGTRVGIEEPGYPDARNIFSIFGALLEPVGIDGEGLRTEALPDGLEFLYVTPSHQVPTGVTMSDHRRDELIKASYEKDFFLIEDDYDSEMNFVAHRSPALRSLDSNRVFYTGSLSKTMFPGVRIGYVITPEPSTKAVMALRRLMIRQPPMIMSLAAGLFFQRGYYDAYIRALHETLRKKWVSMADGVKRYLPGMVDTVASGGTSFWLRLPRVPSLGSALDDLRRKGVLIEDGDSFFMKNPSEEYFSRLGFMSIGERDIVTGLQLMNEMFRKHGLLS